MKFLHSLVILINIGKQNRVLHFSVRKSRCVHCVLCNSGTQEHKDSFPTSEKANIPVVVDGCTYTLYKMFQNDCGIVVGFDNLSVFNFDAYLKSATNYQEPSK
jgi:hypothetical protein